MGNRYGRVLFLREYASYIKDNMIAELTDLSRNLMMSIDVIPIPTDEAVREVENRLLGVETNITNWQRGNQDISNTFTAVAWQCSPPLTGRCVQEGQATSHNSSIVCKQRWGPDGQYPFWGFFPLFNQSRTPIHRMAAPTFRSSFLS